MRPRHHAAPLALLLAACPDPGFDRPPTDKDDPDTDPVVVDTDTSDGWALQQELTMRLTEIDPPRLVLDLDQQAVADLFGEQASEVVMLELDPVPLLTNTLNTIKSACGTDWQNDKANPVFDCSLTELGRTFVGPDGTWRSSPEFALIRILTMTPANSKVDGTSMETLAGIANFLNLGGGFTDILADTLDIPRTEEFLDTAPVAEAMRTNLLASHPAIGPNGFIPFTLEDALTDLATLGERLGPSGNHPGITDPSFVTEGRVFGDDFVMHAEVTSNLRVLDGADLSVGKDYISIIVDETGPTFDDEIEFDFTNPDRFYVAGIEDNPVVDLRFNMFESHRFVPSCGGTSSGADCRNNLPGNPVGIDSVWNLQPWLLEWAIAAGGQVKYSNLNNSVCYILCSFVEVTMGAGNDPGGFGRFNVLFSIGSPPPDQYAWELINEVAQVQLHRPFPGITIPEGDADVAFTMRDIPVGITGPEAAEAVRPFLAEQNDLISDFLLGDYKKNSGPVDFYYRRTEDGQPTLFWVSEDDVGDSRAWGYTDVGFFQDPELTIKLSSTVVSGSADTTHEKWRPRGGDQTVYARDDRGQVYKLDVIAEDLSDDRAELSILVSIPELP